MELKPIDEAQTEAEKVFLKGKTFNAPHPSKQKRDELYKWERDLYHVACALNRRVEAITMKP